MNLRVKSRGFKVTKALHNRVKSKLHRIFSRYGDRIRGAEVTLQDINGPKGGEDMTCLVTIKLNKSKPIVVKEQAADLYDAINTCAQRATLKMERHIKRAQRAARRRGDFAFFQEPLLADPSGYMEMER